MSQHHDRSPSHAGKHAVHLALVERLRRQAADIQRLASGLDETALATSPAPGKWSLKELVCHFRRMEEVIGDRIHRLLTEDSPAIVPYDHPDRDPGFAKLTQDLTGEVLSEFLREREALCRRLESLSPAEWHRQGRHPEYPHYDVHFQVESMAHHEAHHIYQLFLRRAPLGRLPH
jgi:hypothetical protein